MLNNFMPQNLGIIASHYTVKSELPVSGATVWFDTSDVPNIVGDKVRRWVEKINNGSVFSTNSETYKASVQLDSASNKKTLFFPNGIQTTKYQLGSASDPLKTTSLFSHTEGFTHFFVVKNTNGFAPRSAGYYNGSSKFSYHYIFNSGSVQFLLYDFTGAGTGALSFNDSTLTLSPSLFQVVMIKGNVNESNIQILKSSSNNIITKPFNKFANIITDSSLYFQFLKSGTIGDIIYFDRNLSENEWKSMLNYLCTKWNVTNSFPLYEPFWTGWSTAPTYNSSPAQGQGVNWTISGNALDVAPRNALTSFISPSPFVNVVVGGAIDVRGCSSLNNLKIIVDDSLKSINTANCLSLTSLDCSNNLSLTALDFSGCVNLKELNCFDTKLSALDVTGLTNLKWLLCGSGHLSSLNISENTELTEIQCVGNITTPINVAGFNKLTRATFSDTHIPSVDVTGCNELLYFNCYTNLLTSVKITNCPKLLEVSIIESYLTSVDFSGCSEITSIYCQYNSLTSLNILGCSNLVYLDCSNNSLTEESVDKILRDLVVNDCRNTEVYLSEGTSAPPSSAGLIDKTTLEDSNNCQIVVN